jgi:apolipoprotein D and lipocalin family protein
MKNKFLITIYTIMSLSLFSCSSSDNYLEVVDQLDINKYLGTWYEIARLPNSFEKNLDCVSATYTLKENGDIEVLNKGYVINNHPEFKEAKGTAWVPDPKFPAKLKVRFFWPFTGKYWVIELDKDYMYAMVGDPSRDYLWILAREKTLDETIYQKLLKSAEEKGFNTKIIIKVNQNL